MNHGVWDCSVADYPRLENEKSDDQRILRAAGDRTRVISNHTILDGFDHESI